MRFRYAPYRVVPTAAAPNSTLIYRPVIPVRLRGPRGTCRIRALLDTGADESYITQAIAAELGVVQAAPGVSRVQSASGEMETWYGRITLEVTDGNEEHLLPVTVGVVPPEWSEVILGHAGFFEHFEATFSHARKLIELKKTAA